MNNSRKKLISDLFEGDWKDIISYYDIGNLFEIIENIDELDKKKENKTEFENFENNIVNIIINDWENLLNYNKRIFHNYEKYHILLGIIPFMNPSNDKIYKLFDFLIDDGNITYDSIYGQLTEFLDGKTNINMSHIFQKIKDKIYDKLDDNSNEKLLSKMISNYLTYSNINKEDILIFKDIILNNNFKFRLNDLIQINLYGDDKYLGKLNLEKYEVISKNFNLNICKNDYFTNEYNFYSHGDYYHGWKAYKSNQEIFNRFISDNYLNKNDMHQSILKNFLLNHRKYGSPINQMCSIFYLALDRYKYDLTEMEFPIENIVIFNDISIGSKKVILNLNLDTSIELDKYILKYFNDDEIIKNNEVVNKDLFNRFVTSLCNVDFKEKKEFINFINKNFKNELNDTIKTAIENNNILLIETIQNTYLKCELKEEETRKIRRKY